MKDQLAEKLLAQVMGWKSPQEFLDHGLVLQDLAAYKYDEYQQFSPGMRFIESLARWLGQFEKIEERKTALQFVKERLIFVSAAEMNHLVSVAYPDHIRPHLLSKVAAETGLSRWHMGRVASAPEFRIRERRTLFLGLSDGSRTDVFRRANRNLSHEQVRQSHEMSQERVEDLLNRLTEDLDKLPGEKAASAQRTFQTVVLLDDFSGSGLSYIRTKGDGIVGGKVGKFLAWIKEGKSPITTLFQKDELEVVLVLYMATELAEQTLNASLSGLAGDCGATSKVIVVQKLPESTRTIRGQYPELDAIIDRYYDPDNETKSTKLGGTDLKYGFAGGGLSLILSHNTPNNSVGLLWADGSRMRSLFPRVTRHKDTV